jgi:hypothetical protein
MPLVQAQARDWLAYLFTSAMALPGATDAMTAMLRDALADDSPAVRQALRDAATRLSVLLRLGRRDTGWRRYLSYLQSTVTLLLAAQQTPTHEPGARHARHH